MDDDNCPGPGSGAQNDPFCKIQFGINASSNGDTVLVMPGTYRENIYFFGKAITVISSSGAEATVIGPPQGGNVVSFIHGESLDSILDGFTVTNGSGHGIYCSGSSPTIRNNLITKNHSLENLGGGIYLQNSSPEIVNNAITENSTQRNGAGIFCGEDSAPGITNNTISGISAVLRIYLPDGTRDEKTITTVNCYVLGMLCFVSQ